MSRVSFPIHHTFGPLVTREQWKKAFTLQFEPWRWHKGPEIEEFRSELSHNFGASVSLFATGRDALLAVLRSLDLSTGDEVIIQAYTCVVVPNAVHAAKATAVYSDIDPQTLSFDLHKMQAVITPRTKAVICQHTFGIPSDTKKLRAICDRRNLVLIEDCAHIIPDSGSDQMSFMQTSTEEGIGTHGDVLILSFGRDKAISGVSGGAALTRHPDLGKKIAEREKGADQLSSWHILNLIDYPLRYQFAKWIWRTGLAKIYLRWIKLLKLLPPILTMSEKEGKVGLELHKIPNACAILGLQQLKSLGKFNKHRRKLVALYLQAAKEGKWNVPKGVTQLSPLQKFPVYSRSADLLRRDLKKEQVYLDDGWCRTVVNPPSVQQEAAGYRAGSCPIAEDVARHIVTLPTHPTTTEEQAKYVVHALRSYLG